MIDRLRPFWGILLAVTVLLEGPGCAILTYGTSQKIPLTCTPPGAVVTVDGVRAGEAPTTLSLKKKSDHSIRIEKPGYQPVVIELTRRHRPLYAMILAEDVILCVLGGFAIGGGLTGIIGNAVAPREFDAGRDIQWIYLGGIAGAIILPFVSAEADRKSGSLNVLSPDVIEVTLMPVDANASDGAPGPSILRLSADRLDAVRWIRVILR